MIMAVTTYIRGSNNQNKNVRRGKYQSYDVKSGYESFRAGKVPNITVRHDLMYGKTSLYGWVTSN